MLRAAAAAALDKEIIPALYSLDQLVEIAGLTVASSIIDAFPPPRRAIFFCGHGNNGADGLVAARHLKAFGGFDSTVIIAPRDEYPQHYQKLLCQLEALGVPVRKSLEGIDLKSFDFAVDALLGFSVALPLRSPYTALVEAMARVKNIVSVDIPSGWEPDNDSTISTESPCYFMPSVLVSLTAPKPCSLLFERMSGGRPHYVGLSNLIPQSLKEKYFSGTFRESQPVSQFSPYLHRFT